MGGGDDCFLSDIWISLAAPGMLTQEWQLPWVQDLPRPLTVAGWSLAGHMHMEGTGDDIPQASLKGVTSSPRMSWEWAEAEGLETCCSQLSA